MPYDIEPNIKAAFSNFDQKHRKDLFAVRDAIFEVSSSNNDIGPVTETLKWGQPSYLTEKTKSGSTLRLGCTKSGRAAIYVTCSTNLVEQISAIYPDQFEYEGNRGIGLMGPVCETQAELDHVIALIFTYQLRKRKNQ